MCRVCEKAAYPRASSHGLCLAHALLYFWGPWRTVEEFILLRMDGAE